ncbi:TylF/MycF/NovP-related O-methyltransferase [Bradyrhizobium sp. CCBAU 11386]|uniref:TylF/MycF/NovP-related O-methyltransferase n=1 Tax=Bradyrhizobium sp. CCBAU 11386 TaxID=1630837 RepID=UPI0023044D61|nr:TylF/MycF/NovP-related O-methyltransferase [Bradyrhizobium sp. CCBAU 11386]
MKSMVIESAKALLGERQKALLRPPYHFLSNAIRVLRQPRITALPRKIKAIPSLRFRYEFFQAAQAYLQVNRIDGSYLEFGCHEVNTFRMALNTLGQYGKPNKIDHFWAFDSFCGMPEPEGIDKQKIWRANMNFTSQENFLRIVRRDSHRVRTVKGFYSQSLAGLSLPQDQLPALAYIDCDYYSSTKEVLEWLSPYLRHGCLIAFDDWDCYFGDDDRGQRLAFREFREAQTGRLHFVQFMKINSGGFAFICLEREKIGSAYEG